MVTLVIDKNKKEWAVIGSQKPIRNNSCGQWMLSDINDGSFSPLKKGTIKKFTGIDLSFEDEPIIISFNKWK